MPGPSLDMAGCADMGHGCGGITKEIQQQQYAISLQDLPPMIAGRKGQLRENWGMHNLN